jgi:hypothetical protein
MNPQDLLTFIHFNHFTAEWKRLGLTDDDLRSLEMLIMQLPTRGPVMQGTGGLRKIRFAPSRWRAGKSGALRIGYVFVEQYSTVGLVIVFAKNEKANLTMGERKRISELSDEFKRFLERGPRVKGRAK